jgi:hypothetical protein
MSRTIKKVAVIKFNDNYGGLKAWTIQEAYNGNIGDPHSHKVLKREYFNQLQDVIQEYLSKGFSVEISN